ncbi:MAG: LysE family translocator [Paracoccaceae bacterium]
MTELTLALILFLFPLAYSPGPGNMFFAAAGARFGLVATMPASAGYHVATWVMTLVIGLGFAAAAQAAPATYGALRWAGVGYVLWLAWGFLRAGATGSPVGARPAGFGTGAILLLLNPKAYVIIALMFSQFLTVAEGPATVVWITTVFTLNNLLAFTLWTLIGDRLAAQFRSERSARRLNTVFGVLLAGVALWMAAA